MNMHSTQPFATATWSLVPRQTADTVVIDMQNDFLHPAGWYAKSGVDVRHMQAWIEPTKMLVAEARGRGVPIIWTRHGFKDERDAGVFMRLRPFSRRGACGRAAGDTRFWMAWVRLLRTGTSRRTACPPSTTPTSNSSCVRCRRRPCLSLACSRTNASPPTSKDASFRDFKPIVIRECTGTTLPHLHEPALEMMSVGWCEVRSFDDTVREIRDLPLSN